MPTPPPAEFKELSAFYGEGEGFKRSSFENHTHLILEGPNGRLCKSGCNDLLLCQDLKMDTGEVYGAMVYELSYMQACRWIVGTGCPKNPNNLLWVFAIRPPKDEYYWSSVPAMNGVMDAARREELRTILIELAKRIEQAFHMRLFDGLASLRVSYFCVRHHPDLENVAEALGKMERGHQEILRLKAIKGADIAGRSATWLEAIYGALEKTDVQQATYCLEGLLFFIGKNADFSAIGAALNDVVSGFDLLLCFVDEASTYLTRASASRRITSPS